MAFAQPVHVALDALFARAAAFDDADTARRALPCRGSAAAISFLRPAPAAASSACLHLASCNHGESSVRRAGEASALVGSVRARASVIIAV